MLLLVTVLFLLCVVVAVGGCVVVHAIVVVVGDVVSPLAMLRLAVLWCWCDVLLALWLASLVVLIVVGDVCDVALFVLACVVIGDAVGVVIVSVIDVVVCGCRASCAVLIRVRWCSCWSCFVVVVCWRPVSVLILPFYLGIVCM